MKKILFAALALSAALPAHAALVTFTDRAAFLAATTTSSVTTFEGIAPRGNYTGYGNTYNAGAFTVTGPSLYIISEGYDGGLLTPGSSDGLFENSDRATTTFTVAGGTTAFGVDIADYYGAPDQAFTSAEGTMPLSLQSGFFGVISDTALTTFSFTNVSEYDNVTLGAAAVPEPAMLGLFGLGAIGLGFSRRRKAA